MAAQHRRRSGRGLKVALVAAAVIALLGGGTAYAAMRYDRSVADRILPGVEVAGIEVGDMTRDQAIRAIEEEAEIRLSESLSIQAAGHAWTVTPAALGMSADVAGGAERALSTADGMSLLDRLYHRLWDEPVERSYELEFGYDEAAVEGFVQQAYDEVALPAVDAQIALVEDELVTRRSHEGRELKVQLATQRILKSLARQVDSIDVPVRSVPPSVTTASLGMSIVVDVSDNHLWLYDGLRVIKEFDVATGTPGYPTPVGTWEIVDKKENPTWYNPDPEGWGAGLPTSIGPGPGNPLGTRALYLDAPGIRIHGTWSSSSIGTAASHGCIRMHIQDSEEMYPLIPIGTRVIVKP